MVRQSEISLYRMQAAGNNSRYRGMVDAYLSIARTEGMVNGLYRGLGPNIGRNGIVNACETVVYDVTKVQWNSML